MDREVLLPASLVSVPGPKELTHLVKALKERERGLLRVELDGDVVRNDGFTVSQDAPLGGVGVDRLVTALNSQSQLRVLRCVGNFVSFGIARTVPEGPRPTPAHLHIAAVCTFGLPPLPACFTTRLHARVSLWHMLFVSPVPSPPRMHCLTSTSHGVRSSPQHREPQAGEQGRVCRCGLH
jgi:hypothetical protein